MALSRKGRWRPAWLTTATSWPRQRQLPIFHGPPGHARPAGVRPLRRVVVSGTLFVWHHNLATTHSTTSMLVDSWTGSWPTGKQRTWHPHRLQGMPQVLWLPSARDPSARDPSATTSPGNLTLRHTRPACGFPFLFRPRQGQWRSCDAAGAWVHFAKVSTSARRGLSELVGRGRIVFHRARPNGYYCVMDAKEGW